MNEPYQIEIFMAICAVLGVLFVLYALNKEKKLKRHDRMTNHS